MPTDILSAQCRCVRRIATVQEGSLIRTPLFVLSAQAPCWRCGTEHTVVGLGCHSLHDGERDLPPPGDTSKFFLLFDVVVLPLEVLEQLVRRNPLYRLEYSHTAEAEYYANTCECGTFFGDHYLYSIPGGAFCPEDDAAARAITLAHLPFEGTLAIDCVPTYGGTADLLLEHAQRVEPAVDP
jgi:hypothetical protein